MKKNIFAFFSISIIFLFISATLISVKTVEDFSLKNVDGKIISLKDYPHAKGYIVIFTCNHCPFAKLYPPRLNELNAHYSKFDVPLLAISSTDTVVYEEDSFIKMVKKAKKEHFNFPYLYDEKQTVAKTFGADKTPHAFVIWKEDAKWSIKYSGAIDDNGAEPTMVKNRYVAMAVDALLEGKLVDIPETRSIGCQILMRK